MMPATSPSPAPMVGLCALLIVAAAQGAALALLPRALSWAARREIQLLVLALPTLAVAFGALALLLAPYAPACGAWGCVAPVGRLTISLGVLVAGLTALPAAVAAAALILGIVRVALLHHTVARRSVPAPDELAQRAARLAARVGALAPRVRLCPVDRPLALTYGLRRPTLVLSRWMVERLDARELDAVLAHELAHGARRDFVVLWVATVLRDAFCYLPASRAAYRLLQREKELACDDLAVAATRRPLGLASALAKVWPQAVADAGLGLGQALVDPHGSVEGRITRLLDAPRLPARTNIAPSHRPPSAASLRVLGLLVLVGAAVALALTLMGCAPVLPGR